MNERIPILIDTDPGVDDFFCIAIGCAFPDRFDLKAITTIGGNNRTAVTTQNALNIVHLLGRDDVPVYAGADRYLEAEFGEPVAKFHGRNGLGNIEIPASPKGPGQEEGCEVIYRTAVDCKGELVLVTVGPETNLGLAFRRHPDLAGLVKKIVVMGGSTDAGNVTPYAEANIFHDPEAADLVFRSGVPIDMIGLNVTMKSDLPRRIFDPLSEATRPDVRQAMQQLIDFRNGEPMHDAVAIATLLDDSFLDWICCEVTVDVSSAETRGRTEIHPELPGSVRVACAVRPEGYYEIVGRMAARFS